jgi:hypothetical protein
MLSFSKGHHSEVYHTLNDLTPIVSIRAVLHQHAAEICSGLSKMDPPALLPCEGLIIGHGGCDGAWLDISPKVLEAAHMIIVHRPLKSTMWGWNLPEATFSVAEIHLVVNN